ncbi:MAG: glucose 1-dehydrogenase [Chloroflexi bacterium]|nr:glucose 1-dehydrogenase [Chloroflexota bacterium]
MKLLNRAALVTGGATGIGRAICLALAAEGAAVTVNYSRSRAEAEELVDAIEKAGGRASAIAADVSDAAAAARLVDDAAARFGRLDILVNNAGFTRRTPHRDLELLTDELIERTLSVNTLGPLYCARAAIPHMLRNGGGSIVNITSVAGRSGNGSSIVYGGSKAALSTITRSLARAFAPEIRVNAVAPGLVDTGFVDWPEQVFESARERSHIGRLVEVADVAALVLFLVIDGSAFTGEEFVVDGGVNALGPRG